MARSSALNDGRLGPSRVDALLEKGLVQHFDDFFTLTEGDLLTLEGFAEVSAKKLVESIKKVSKQVSLSRLITGLSIPHVGEETALLLAENFKTIDDTAKANEEKLAAIDGIGPIVAKAIVDWFGETKNKIVIERLKKVLHIGNLEFSSRSRFSNLDKKPLAGKIFVLTGTLESMSRDEAKEKIRKLGGSVSSSVSKKTFAVVAGADPGSKRADAEKLGVQVVSEREFLGLTK